MLFFFLFLLQLQITMNSLAQLRLTDTRQSSLLTRSFSELLLLVFARNCRNALFGFLCSRGRVRLFSELLQDLLLFATLTEWRCRLGSSLQHAFQRS